MIGTTLSFLRHRLDEHLRAKLGNGDDTPSTERVVFVEGDKMDPMTFKLGAVSELLVNVQEERVLRDADPWHRKIDHNVVQRVSPDIRLILRILFVARFKRYDLAWQHLSTIIEFFQANRVFDKAGEPPLPEGLERLFLELETLGFAEQNEIWNALRTTHHPSIMYRATMVSFRDREPQPEPQVGTVDTVVTLG